MKKIQFYKEIVKSVTAFNIYRKRCLVEDPKTSLTAISGLAQYSRLVYLAYAELRGVSLNRVEQHCRYPYNESVFKTIKERLELMYQIYNDIEVGFKDQDKEEMRKIVQAILFDHFYLTSLSYHNLEISFERFGRKVTIKLGNTLLIKQYKENLELTLEVEAEIFIIHRVLYYFPTSLTKNQIIKDIIKNLGKGLIRMEVL